MDFMSDLRPAIADKRQTFRILHEAGCFVIPNPWNVGTARYLQSLGFKALATTSAGDAHAQGYPDGAQSRDDVLAHFRQMATATDVPLNADFENGFADDPDGVAENVTRCIATGVAGLSIEDSPKNDTPLYDFDIAVARVKAARAAIDRAGGGVVFTARAENFLRGVADIEDVTRRLRAYAAAGADCLYAPGIKTREHIEAGGRRGGRSRWTSSTAVLSVSPSAISRGWACAGSASAERWRAWRCTLSSAPRPKSPRTASSTASPDLFPILS